MSTQPIERNSRRTSPQAGKLQQISSGFPDRLREAFDGQSNASIARRLETTDTTIKTYMDGGRLPVSEMLLRITRATGTNIHWLLTGEGPRRVLKADELFSGDEEKAIAALAKRSGRSVDEQVRVLTLAAIRFSDEI